MDKSWIQIKNRAATKYLEGIEAFMKVARCSAGENETIRCPCQKCINLYYHTIDDVHIHLYSDGMDRTYTQWFHHGETLEDPIQEANNERMTREENVDANAMQDMIEDLYTGTFMDTCGGESFETDSMDVSGGEKETDTFACLLGDAERELYPGCKKYSKLSCLIKLLHVKLLNGWSNKSFDMILELIKDILPEGETLPKSYYESKKVLRDVGLGYESIHACRNDCVLFWKEHEKKDKCPKCNESRYKHVSAKGKGIPYKVLRYFPLKPRLQRLFMSRKTAVDMRWHKEQRSADLEVKVLRHPAVSEAYEEFDKKHGWFAEDSRNIRLGLASDGFNPFRNMSTAYRMWPVVLIPYNLPPWKCMKQLFFMMSLFLAQSLLEMTSTSISPAIDRRVDGFVGAWGNGVKT